MDADDTGIAWEILQRYADPATSEFDAVLAGAGLPEEVARALRFWQRESVANVRQFAAEALPVVLKVLRDAESGIAASTRLSGAAYGAPVPLDPTVSRLEERRRTVAARLIDLG